MDFLTIGAAAAMSCMKTGTCDQMGQGEIYAAWFFIAVAVCGIVVALAVLWHERKSNSV